MGEIDCTGWGAQAADQPLAPMSFTRRAPMGRELLIDVAWCGVCHSDLHQARDEWGNTQWPCVPGHEIIGTVREAGPDASKFRAGDRVGVGCFCNSCRVCEPCRSGLEQYCEGPVGVLATYNGPMNPAGENNPGANNIYGLDNTFGGYSNAVVIDEDFVLRIPEGLDPARAAPILCAGVTTWSPLRNWNVTGGDKVGVIGLGGLGHMATKLAVAMGAEVVVFTRTPEKEQDARAMGAIDVVVGDDEEALRKHLLSFDFILSTAPSAHDINPYIRLLKRDATLCLVGALEPMVPVDNAQVAFHRRNVAGSLVGGLRETQEVLDFCAEHGVQPDVEPVRMDAINGAFERMSKGDVRYRFVIDMRTLEAA